MNNIQIAIPTILKVGPGMLDKMGTYIKEKDYEDLVEKNNKNQRKQEKTSFYSKVKNLFK